MTARNRHVKAEKPAKKLKLRASNTRFDGTAVRLPKEDFIEIPGLEKTASRKVKQNREKMQRMSPAYVTFLSAICVVVMALCINYVRLEANIQINIQKVAELKEAIQTKKNMNEAIEEKIAIASDINVIYKTATEELGMVYPDDGQVIYYDQTEREYVQQYEDIPK